MLLLILFIILNFIDFNYTAVPPIYINIGGETIGYNNNIYYGDRSIIAEKINGDYIAQSLSDLKTNNSHFSMSINIDMTPLYYNETKFPEINSLPPYLRSKRIGILQENTMNAPFFRVLADHVGYVLIRMHTYFPVSFSELKEYSPRVIVNEKYVVNGRKIIAGEHYKLDFIVYSDFEDIDLRMTGHILVNAIEVHPLENNEIADRNLCDVNYYPMNNICAPCPIGMVKQLVGNYSCLAYPRIISANILNGSLVSSGLVTIDFEFSEPIAVKIPFYYDFSVNITTTNNQRIHSKRVLSMLNVVRVWFHTLSNTGYIVTLIPSHLYGASTLLYWTGIPFTSIQLHTQTDVSISHDVTSEHCFYRNGTCADDERIRVSTDSDGTFAIEDDDNSTYYNWDNALLGTKQHFNSFCIVDRSFCGILANGTLVCVGQPYIVNGYPRTGQFLSIDCAGYYACATRIDNVAVCFGDPVSGRTIPPPHERLVFVATGGTHACGLRTNQTVVCWGEIYENAFFTLDNFDPNWKFDTLDCGNWHCCGVTFEGKVHCFGENSTQKLDVPENLPPVMYTVSGYDHTCAFTDGIVNGSNVVCWGDNIGSPPPIIFGVIRSSSKHVCGLDLDGKLHCFGSDDYQNMLWANEISLRDSYSSLDIGNQRACLQKTNGGIKCITGTGSGDHFLFSTSDIALYTPYRDSLGPYLRCFTDLGHQECNGFDQNGQTHIPEGVEFVQLSLGGFHTCGLTSKGFIKCFGKFDFYNQIENTPVNSGFVGLDSGKFHSCGILANLSVVCWGSNVHGERDIPISLKFVKINLGYFYTCGLTIYGEILCFGGTNGTTEGVQDYKGEASPPANLSSDIISVSAGLQHTCYLSFSGKAGCFGWGSNGQSSPPENETYVHVDATDGIDALGGATCLITITNRWFCIGAIEVLRTLKRSDIVNQFLNNPMLLTYVKSSASNEVACILQGIYTNPDEMLACSIEEFDITSSEGSIILALDEGIYNLQDFLWRDASIIHVMPLPSVKGEIIFRCSSIACLALSKSRVVFQNIIFEYYDDSSINIESHSLAIFRNCIFRMKTLSGVTNMLVVTGGSSLVVQNSIFLDGVSIDGGAVFSSSSSIYVINSTFENFRATTSGGVFRCAELSSCILNKCLLLNNVASSGAGVYTSRSLIVSYLTKFQSNLVNYGVSSHGGASIDSTLSFLYIEKTEFIADKAPKGASITSTHSSIYLYDASFLNSSIGINEQTVLQDDTVCTSTKPGGVLYASVNDHIEIYNSLFMNNSAMNSCGGAIYILNGYLKLNNTILSNNIALFGGSLCVEATNTYSTYLLSNVKIHSNIALSSGGGLFINNIIGHIYNSQVFNNIASQDGGGIWMNLGKIYLHDYTLVQYNHAKYGGGGGIYSQQDHLQLNINPNLPIFTTLYSSIINNTQFYGKDLTSGPFKIFLRQKPSVGNIRYDFSPEFDVCVIDTNSEIVFIHPFYQTITDGFNLKLIIEADLLVNTSLAAQLVGTTKRDLSLTGCGNYLGLQYSGVPNPNVPFRFSTSVTQFQRTLNLEEITNVVIHPCKAGSEYVEAQGVCQICSPGYHSSYDGDVCKKCSIGYVAQKHNTINCTKCEPPYFQLKSGGIECETCQAGTYAICSDTTCSGECNTCPEGAYCDGGEVSAQSSVWLYTSSNGEVDSFVCPRCLSNNLCQHGRKQPASQNPLCGQCLDGKSEWGQECLDCDGVSWLVVVLFLAMLVLVLLVHIDSQISTAPTKILVYYAQICSVMVATVYLDWLRFFNFSVLNAPSRGECLFPVSHTDRLWIGFITPLLAFAQLVAILICHWLIAKFFCKNRRKAIAANHRRPSVMEMAEMDGDKSFVLTNETLVMPWEIISTRRSSISIRRALNIPLFGAILPISSYIRTCIGLYLFSFNAIVATLFEFFDCTNVGNDSFVKSNPAVSCDSSSYQNLYPLMVLLTLVCLIIIPGLFAYLLFFYWKKHLLRTRNVRKWLGVLYESFKHECYFYQLIVLARRTIIVAVAVFVDDLKFKQSLLTSINFGVLLLHIRLQPFGEYYDNIFESISLCFLTVIAANLREPITNTNAIFLCCFVLIGLIIQLTRVIMVKLGKMDYPSVVNGNNETGNEGRDDDETSSKHYIVRPPMI